MRLPAVNPAQWLPPYRITDSGICGHLIRIVETEQRYIWTVKKRNIGGQYFIYWLMYHPPLPFPTSKNTFFPSQGILKFSLSAPLSPLFSSFLCIFSHFSNYFSFIFNRTSLFFKIFPPFQIFFPINDSSQGRFFPLQGQGVFYNTYTPALHHSTALRSSFTKREIGTCTIKSTDKQRDDYFKCLNNAAGCMRVSYSCFAELQKICRN